MDLRGHWERERKWVRNGRKGVEMILCFQETVVLKKNREHTNLGGNSGDGDRWSSWKGGNSGWVLSKHIICMYGVFGGKKSDIGYG